MPNRFQILHRARRCSCRTLCKISRRLDQMPKCYGLTRSREIWVQNEFPIITLYNGNIKAPRYWPFVQGIHRSPVNSPHKGQWHGALMFHLICTWINGWVNNREAGDLRRHRAHYDVTIMQRACMSYIVQHHCITTKTAHPIQVLIEIPSRLHLEDNM